MKTATISTLAVAMLVSLAACSEPASGPKPQAKPPAKTADVKPVPTVQAEAPVVALPVAVAASLTPAGQAIDAAALAIAPDDKSAKSQQLIRVQVLLDRAHFSPGVIDGKAGGNLTQALRAYQSAKGLAASGQLDQATWDALTQADAGPVMTDYVVTETDVQGPFLPEIPKEFADQAKLDRLGYASVTEMLAERFHMDEALLKALNPQVDFMAAGTSILVAAPRTAPLAAKVTRIEVDKAERTLRAYDDRGRVVAAYPATVGSTERPAPEGASGPSTPSPPTPPTPTTPRA